MPSIEAVVSHSALVGVFLVALALVLTPGPNMMYLVSRSISQARIAGLISLTGRSCSAAGA